MHQTRLFKLLLQPSLLSAALVSVASGLIVAIGNWAGIINSRLGYDYLSLGTVLDTTPTAVTARLSDLFSGQAFYITLVCVVAVAVSIGVYLFLGSIEQAAASILNTLFNVQSAKGSAKRQAMAEAGVRTSFRVVVLIAWILYSVLFAAFLLPTLVALFQNGIADLAHVAWLALIVSYVGLWFALHVHLIFLRLFLLRPRVFGGTDVIAAGLE